MPFGRNFQQISVGRMMLFLLNLMQEILQKPQILFTKFQKLVVLEVG